MVLLVEDDPKLAGAVARGLRHEGYAVDPVPDGDAALMRARVWDYDAIVLDVMLPGRDGFEAAPRCASANAGRRSSCSPPAGRSATASAASTWAPTTTWPSPLDFGELLARLRALVRRAPASRAARLEVGDLVVDPSTHEVARAGVAVALTAREFAVLEYLARHAGEAITRAALLDHVWDENFEGATNIVDVYVGYLRRKLEQPFDRPLIRTIRGVGYALESEP